jgi:hypothetical protein
VRQDSKRRARLNHIRFHDPRFRIRNPLHRAVRSALIAAREQATMGGRVVTGSGGGGVPVRIVVVCTSALLCAISAVPVRAQAPAGAEAETLFRRGQDLLAQGKLADACAAFDGAQKLDPTTSTQLNRANCREKNGQLATAWGLFLEAERETRGRKDGNALKWHKLASDRAAKLEPRLSTLTISVPADSQIGGLELLRDGAAVDQAAWNQALPVDGGEHLITARAPGNAEWSTKLTVGGERDVQTVLIPKLRPVIGATRPPLAPAAEAEGAAVVSAPATAPRAPRIWLPITVGAAGVAMLGGALGFELSASSTYDQSKKERDPAKQDSLWHSANTRRYVAEGLGIAGLAAGGVAVWLYFHERGQERASGLAFDHVPTPIVGGDRAGLQLGGTF